jgi:hypothetical protein
MTMTAYTLTGIPPDLWRAARAKAAAEGITMRGLLLAWLESYAQRTPTTPTPEQEQQV